MSERCEDLISREKAIYAVADYIHNVDRVFSTGLLSDDDCKDAAASVLENLPSEQSEVTEENVREWCYKRCLTIIDNALYFEMRSRWLPPAQPDLSEYSDKLWRSAYERGKRDAQPEQRWIPCSERLPEYGCPVLWCNENGSVFVSAITVKTDHGWAIGKRHRMCEVIAWMPLPEPYRGE